VTRAAIGDTLVRILRHRWMSLGLLAVCVVALAPSALTSQAGAVPRGTNLTRDTLTIPFTSEMQTIDPNVYYAAEGLLVTRALYQGLLKDAPNPANVPLQYLPPAKRRQPSLATSWSVSKDGLTYTFHLRSGVRFHDGTPMTAKSWQLAFARDRAIDQGPAYMVKVVKSTSAPNPLTFVVKLYKPSNPFLDWMASPYAPVAISPAVLSKYSGDRAQNYLRTHDAGTGPYQMTEYVPNDHYTLEAFQGYWGRKAYFKKVVIRIIPNLETQKALLSAGEVNLMTKGLSVQDLQHYQKDKDVTVTRLAMAFSMGFYIKPTGVFNTVALRSALKHAIDKRAVVPPAYGGLASVSTTFYAPGMFPKWGSKDDPKYDPSILKSLIPRMSSKNIDIAYGVEFGEPVRRLANLIQVQLQALGLNAKTRVLQTAVLYSLYKAPMNTRPDILVQPLPMDALHPDGVRISFQTDAEPVNYYNYSYPAIDKGINRGLHAKNYAQFIAAYRSLAKTVLRQAISFTLADLYDVVVAQKGITGFVHDAAAPQAISIGDLRLTQ
jgi:peptide/nickel transport system substrate-binding protein